MRPAPSRELRGGHGDTRCGAHGVGHMVWGHLVWDTSCGAAAAARREEQHTLHGDIPTATAEPLRAVPTGHSSHSRTPGTASRTRSFPGPSWQGAAAPGLGAGRCGCRPAPCVPSPAGSAGGKQPNHSAVFIFPPVSSILTCHSKSLKHVLTENVYKQEKCCSFASNCKVIP